MMTTEQRTLLDSLPLPELVHYYKHRLAINRQNGGGRDGMIQAARRTEFMLILADFQGRRSLTALARALAVNFVTVSRWANGHNYPDWATRDRMVVHFRALGYNDLAMRLKALR